MDAPQAQILVEIKALSSHYPRRQLGKDDLTRWYQDFATDLEGFSEADVRMACAIWRKGDHKKMPSPGELLVICDKLRGERPTALPPPKREIEFSETHKAEMRGRLKALAEQMKLRPRSAWGRHSGESEVDLGRRLWPNREVRA